MQITTSELRKALTKVLDHLDNAGQGVLTVDKDYYWCISADQRYDPYKQPVEFSLGQLSDDWSELQKIVEGQSAPVGYALVWLSSIIHAIGEENIA
jgi:hypothetical protein